MGRISSFYQCFLLAVILLLGPGLSGCGGNSSVDTGSLLADKNAGGVVMHAVVNGGTCGSLYTDYHIVGDTGKTYTLRNDVKFMQKIPTFNIERLPTGGYSLQKITCPQAWEVAGFGALSRFTVTAGQISNLGVLTLTSSPRGRGGLIKNLRNFTAAEQQSFAKDHPDIQLIYTPMQAG